MTEVSCQTDRAVRPRPGVHLLPAVVLGRVRVHSGHLVARRGGSERRGEGCCRRGVGEGVVVEQERLGRRREMGTGRHSRPQETTRRVVVLGGVGELSGEGLRGESVGSGCIELWEGLGKMGRETGGPS